MKNALQHAMCGDFCAEDSCPRCADARLEALLPFVARLPLKMLSDTLKKVHVLHKEGLCHPDAMKYLQEYRQKLLCRLTKK